MAIKTFHIMRRLIPEASKRAFSTVFSTLKNVFARNRKKQTKLPPKTPKKRKKNKQDPWVPGKNLYKHLQKNTTILWIKPRILSFPRKYVIEDKNVIRYRGRIYVHGTRPRWNSHPTNPRLDHWQIPLSQQTEHRPDPHEVATAVSEMRETDIRDTTIFATGLVGEAIRTDPHHLKNEQLKGSMPNPWLNTIEAIRRVVETIVADGVITEDEYNILESICDALGLDVEEVLSNWARDVQTKSSQ